MGSKCHTNCHQATSRCMSQVVCQHTGNQAQGPTYSRLGPGLFSDAQGLPLGLVFKDSGKARPTSRGHKSPSGGAQADRAPRRAGWPGSRGLVGGWGESSGSIPRVLVTAPWHPCFPEAPSLFPWTLPYPGLGQEKTGRTRAASSGSWRPAWSQ